MPLIPITDADYERLQRFSRFADSVEQAGVRPLRWRMSLEDYRQFRELSGATDYLTFRDVPVTTIKSGPYPVEM